LEGKQEVNEIVRIPSPNRQLNKK